MSIQWQLVKTLCTVEHVQTSVTLTEYCCCVLSLLTNQATLGEECILKSLHYLSWSKIPSVMVPKVCCSFHNSPQLIPSICQMNAVCIIISCFFKTFLIYSSHLRLVLPKKTFSTNVPYEYLTVPCLPCSLPFESSLI
jgi:hypothetical protein